MLSTVEVSVSATWTNQWLWVLLGWKLLENVLQNKAEWDWTVVLPRMWQPTPGRQSLTDIASNHSLKHVKLQEWPWLNKKLTVTLIRNTVLFCCFPREQRENKHSHYSSLDFLRLRGFHFLCVWRPSHCSIWKFPALISIQSSVGVTRICIPGAVQNNEWPSRHICLIYNCSSLQKCYWVPIPCQTLS